MLGEERGVHGRDALWAHPDLIPSAEDLDDPAGFVGRSDSSDPIAELEKLANSTAPVEDEDGNADEDGKNS
jgi:hypothetical protein